MKLLTKQGDDTMDYAVDHITQASEAVHWEDLDVEMYHKYNQGTDEFLQELTE